MGTGGFYWKVWDEGDLNPRPHDLQSCALPAELPIWFNEIGSLNSHGDSAYFFY